MIFKRCTVFLTKIPIEKEEENFPRLIITIILTILWRWFLPDCVLYSERSKRRRLKGGHNTQKRPTEWERDRVANWEWPSLCPSLHFASNKMFCLLFSVVFCVCGFTNQHLPMCVCERPSFGCRKLKKERGMNERKKETQRKERRNIKKRKD